MYSEYFQIRRHRRRLTSSPNTLPRSNLCFQTQRSIAFEFAERAPKHRVRDEFVYKREVAIKILFVKLDFVKNLIGKVYFCCVLSGFQIPNVYIIDISRCT